MGHGSTYGYSMVGRAADISAPASPDSGNSLRDQWNKCLKRFRQEVPPQTYQTWFMPILPVSLHQKSLILRVPSRFFFEWLDSHYIDLVRKVIADVFGGDVAIEFLIAPNRQDVAEISRENVDDLESITTSDTAQSVTRAAVTNAQLNTLDPRFTFERFFAGQENELAYKAAMAISEGSARLEYSPLVLHGQSGSGKTHLMQAIGHSALQQHPQTRVKLISSEQFLHDYVAAVQSNQMKKFLDTMLAVDYLLFEDVQFLAGKNKSQDELYFILSELMKKRARIVLSFNQSPMQIQQLNERIACLCQKGLIIDLHPAQNSTRDRLIRYQLGKENIHLEEKVIQFLAESLPGNLHHLSAIMVRIVAQISLLGRGLGLKEARYLVSQFADQNSGNGDMAAYRREVSIGDICRATAQYFEIPLDILQGISRKQRIVKARQVAIYLCREMTVDSLSSIGYHFSNLHHASVLYACKKVRSEIEKKPAIKAHVDKISAILNR